MSDRQDWGLRPDIDGNGRLVRAADDINRDSSPRVSVEDYLEAWQSVTLAAAAKEIALFLALLTTAGFVAQFLLR